MFGELYSAEKDPETANDPQIGPQMIPGSQMILKLNQKRPRDKNRGMAWSFIDRKVKIRTKKIGEIKHRPHTTMTLWQWHYHGWMTKPETVEKAIPGQQKLSKLVERCLNIC